MRYLICSIALFSSFILSGQPSNLIFFTEAGENFTLYVNGSQINEQPTANVKAMGISGDFAQVKVIFETPGAPELKQGMLVDPGMVMTSIIKKNKKGKYILRPVSSSAVSAEPQSETVAITKTTPPSSAQPNSTNAISSGSTPSSSETLGVSVNVGGQSVGLSVQMDGMNEPSPTGVQTSSSVTAPAQGAQLAARVEGKNIVLSDGRIYTFNYYNANRIGPVVEMKNPIGARVSLSYDDVESYSGEVPFLYKEEDWKKSSAYFKLTVNEAAGSWSVKLKHSGKIVIDGAAGQQVTYSPTPSASVGCTSPMSGDSFNRAKSSIEGKSFGDEQMTVFRQIVRSNCMSVNQIIQFMDLFTYEEEKIQVAKLAHPKTVDKGNYYQVNDALTYADSVEELETFLNRQ